MKNLDLYSKIAVRRAISPVSVADNTAAVSQVIDRQGFTALMFAIALGAIADADTTMAVLVEHADISDMTGAVAVPDAELNGTEAAAGFQFDDDNETRKIGYVGNKRYVRLSVVSTSVTSGATVGATAVRDRPAVGAVAQ